MKKAVCLLVLCLFLLPVFAAGAEQAGPSGILLYTAYRQMGWGDRVQAGCVDENGLLWFVSGYDSELKWPYRAAEQIAWLEGTGYLVCIGRLGSDELFALKSLVLSAEDQGSVLVPAANDAGTEFSYAVRCDPDGTPVPVLLGASGDSMFENTDPNAQALYLLLRQLFPRVTCYAGEGSMGPLGFIPVSAAAFCGWDVTDLAGCAVTGIREDCEEGPVPLEIDPETRSDLLDLVLNGKVTGKASAVQASGGTTLYTFLDAEGSVRLSLTLCGGLLVMPDGMYYLSR